jgi:hypothetical protein
MGGRRSGEHAAGGEGLNEEAGNPRLARVLNAVAVQVIPHEIV